MSFDPTPIPTPFPNPIPVPAPVAPVLSFSGKTIATVAIGFLTILALGVGIGYFVFRPPQDSQEIVVIDAKSIYSGPIGKMMAVRASTKVGSGGITYFVPEKEKNCYDLAEHGNDATVVPQYQGNSELILLTVYKGKPYIKRVSIIGTGPGPDPGPNPPPVPPPPGPNPPPVPPPAPSTDYEKAIKAGWQQEFDKDKLTQVKALAKVYTYGVSESASGLHKTTGDVYGSMTKKAFELLVKGKLLNLQTSALGPEWTRRLPDDTNVALTPDLKDKMGKFFKETSDLLEKLQ